MQNEQSIGKRFGITGCGDSSCYIDAPPKGSMHTNGGCRCSPHKFHRIIQRLIVPEGGPRDWATCGYCGELRAVSSQPQHSEGK